MFDLTGWELIYVWEARLFLFANGNHRVVIDKITAEVITEYDFK